MRTFPSLLGAGALLLSTALPALAQDYDVEVTTTPPTPQVEVVPASRTGYTWSPGYWAWNTNANKYEWVKGHWIAERPNAHWVPDRWVQDTTRPNHWYYRAGHWEVS